jgi:hypothetical protein
MFRKQVWCWKSFLIILKANGQFWIFENRANASQNSFWFGNVLRKFGCEPT